MQCSETAVIIADEWKANPFRAGISGRLRLKVIMSEIRTIFHGMDDSLATDSMFVCVWPYSPITGDKSRFKRAFYSNYRFFIEKNVLYKYRYSSNPSVIEECND